MRTLVIPNVDVALDIIRALLLAQEPFQAEPATRPEVFHLTVRDTAADLVTQALIDAGFM